MIQPLIERAFPNSKVEFLRFQEGKMVFRKEVDSNGFTMNGGRKFLVFLLLGYGKTAQDAHKMAIKAIAECDGK